MTHSNSIKKLDAKTIIKEKLATGPLRFNELKRRTGLSSRTLARHLEEMEKNGEVMRTVLQDKSGVFYVLVDRKFKETKAVIGKLLEEAFYAAKEYMDTFNITGFQALMFAIGEALFMVIISYANNEKMRQYAIALILDFLEHLLLPPTDSKFERLIIEAFNKISTEVAELNDRELDDLLKKLQERILKAEDEWMKKIEERLKEKGKI